MIKFRKILKSSLLLMLAVVMLSSCKEEKIETPETAAVNVVHAVMDVPTMKVSFNGTAHPTLTNYGAGTNYGAFAGSMAIKAEQSTDATRVVYSASQTLKSAGIYSLYLFGQYPNTESLFVEDSFPTFTKEECGIRVVNLSPNGAGLNVTLSATPTVNEFENLAYKQISPFKTYPIPFTSVPAGFTFQVRDNMGTVRATYALTAANITAVRYKRATLVIRGMVGGTGTTALALGFVANY